MKKVPKLVERVDDGEILRLNGDGKTYSFVNSHMHTPHRYTHQRLFRDQRSTGKFREFEGIDLSSKIINCARQIRNGKPYSLFAVKRSIMLPSPTNQGNYLYANNPALKKEFNQYISDDEFHTRGYTDVSGGPFNNEIHVDSWENEVNGVIGRREPENLVFYLRQDPKLVAARILISVADFYGGLTEKEAEKKYGKQVFDKMSKHLNGITISRDGEGQIRIPYSDLEYAHKKAIGNKTKEGAWD